MTALTLAELRTEGETFSEEIARESFLAHAGYKPEADLEPIYARHARVTGPEALELVLDSYRQLPPEADGDQQSEERRSLRLLLEWQVEANVSRQLVELDEREIAWESRATVEVPGGRALQYQRAPIEIANAVDRTERLAIDEARALAAGAEHGPLRRERLQRERELVESFAIGRDYVRSFEAITGISLSYLGAQCASFLRGTQAMWDEVLPYFLRTVLGLSRGTATRADALRLFRAADFDAGFPAEDLTSAVERHVREMGLDPTAGGRILYDLEERPGKRARAFCAPVRVPAEVYLVLRPHGGQNDYTTLLHELGHALHFAWAAEELPFEFRWLGDNSVTETFAMLFDHRMQDRGWLARYTRLGDRLDAYRRMAVFEELHFIRRYCGKLLYELQVYETAGGWERLADAYVERLSTATGFLYRLEDAFVDLDPGFYSARYLRAWQLQSLLAERLVDGFNEDWYRNPAAGHWLTGELLSRGQRDSADDIARRLGSELSFSPLIRSIEQGFES